MIDDGVAPEDIFRSVSHLLFERTPPEKYATSLSLPSTTRRVLSGTAMQATTRVSLLRANSETEWLESTGMPLGILPEGVFTAGERTLEAGDSLILYTDGITEPENPEEEEYGEDRLRAVCVKYHTEPLAQIKRAIEKDLHEFVRGVPFPDDQTLVLIRRLGE